MTLNCKILKLESKIINILYTIIFLFFLSGCHVSKYNESVIIFPKVKVEKENKIENNAVHKIEPEKFKKLSELEQILIAAGLVKIKDYDSTIIIDLKYATKDNFLKKNLYGEFKDGYLQEPVVKQLAKAQSYLKDTFPEYSLVVYDAVRPLSIQKMMWDSIKVSADQRSRFLSNPSYGSLHNYGAAVDVSIVDKSGKELDMGTPFDFFEPVSFPVLEREFLQKGVLTKQQIANRSLLRYVMGKALFYSIPTEWWHFNSCGNREAKIYYPMIKYHTLKKHPKLHIENVDNVNIRFKVQIKVSLFPLDIKSSEFKELSVGTYKQNGLYKYVVGDFTDIASAYEMQGKVNKLGFPDAFVVAFNNNNRIEVQDAIQLMP